MLLKIVYLEPEAHAVHVHKANSASDSAATLVHAFVTSRIDYDNALLAKAPKIWTEKLQRVLNAAARVITGTRCMTVYKCLHGLAPKYLAELCVPVANVAGRRQLRSASRGLLNFPRYNMSNTSCVRRR